MSIVPVSRLSAEDLACLGNNLVKRSRAQQPRRLQAVNRSLAVHGEQVRRLHRPAAGVALPSWPGAGDPRNVA